MLRKLLKRCHDIQLQEKIVWSESRSLTITSRCKVERITFSLVRATNSLSLSLSLYGNSNSVMLNRSTPLGNSDSKEGTEWELFATISLRNLLPIWLVRHGLLCRLLCTADDPARKPAEYVCRETTWKVGIFYFTGNHMVKRASSPRGLSKETFRG